jgi:superfamily II DNA or RNA helicase
MKINILFPTLAKLESFTSEEYQLLYKQLSYTNTNAQHNLKRHYNNIWLRKKNKEAWESKLNELKSKVHNTLVFTENGQYFIRPGSLTYLHSLNLEITTSVGYKPLKKVAWSKKLPFELHDYQKQSIEKLMDIKHGNISLCTGSGKSAIILTLCREMGLNAAIVAPSASIFSELGEKFDTHFGGSLVGYYGDGRKKIGKRFTVCIGDSLVNVKQNTKEWDFFSNLDVLIVDESHLWGAETLEKVCHGIFANVPYRFFLSGTQTRSDGTERLLQSIIGPTVHTLTTAEAIKGGYVCNHDFTIISLESSNPNMNSTDILEMKRIHFLRNRNIATVAAKIANADALANGRQTLILVEELSQISMLLPLLKVPYAYAHSDSKKELLAELGLEKVDSSESVEKFNKNEVKVLIGTSCIATGTNIYPTHNTINWVGGSSEIKAKQGAVGRSVRLHRHNPWADKCVEKTKAHIYDFNIVDVLELSSQLEDRIGYYRESETEIKYVKLK